MSTPKTEHVSYGYECQDRRRTDTQPVPMRSALAAQLVRLGAGMQTVDRQKLVLAAETLERDEKENAEMIDVLVKAGYQDVPARVDAKLIRRLLGYITPR